MAKKRDDAKDTFITANTSIVAIVAIVAIFGFLSQSNTVTVDMQMPEERKDLIGQATGALGAFWPAEMLEGNTLKLVGEGQHYITIPNGGSKKVTDLFINPPSGTVIFTYEANGWEANNYNVDVFSGEGSWGNPNQELSSGVGFVVELPRGTEDYAVQLSDQPLTTATSIQLNPSYNIIGLPACAGTKASEVLDDLGRNDIACTALFKKPNSEGQQWFSFDPTQDFDGEKVDFEIESFRGYGLVCDLIQAQTWEPECETILVPAAQCIERFLDAGGEIAAEIDVDSCSGQACGVRNADGSVEGCDTCINGLCQVNAGQPDLIITDAQVSFRQTHPDVLIEGDNRVYYDITATVKNIGTAATQAQNVHMCSSLFNVRNNKRCPSNGPSQVVFLDALGPNEERDVSWSEIFSFDRDIEIVSIDSRSEIIESNEDNNLFFLEYPACEDSDGDNIYTSGVYTGDIRQQDGTTANARNVELDACTFGLVNNPGIPPFIPAFTTELPPEATEYSCGDDDIIDFETHGCNKCGGQVLDSQVFEGSILTYFSTHCACESAGDCNVGETCSQGECIPAELNCLFNDNDGDGFSRVAGCYPFDCRDDDASSVPVVAYYDHDGDGVGVQASQRFFSDCAPLPANYVTQGGDCNDLDPSETCVDEDLIAYLPFDGGTNDAAQGRNTENKGADCTVEGISGNACQFDGSDLVIVDKDIELVQDFTVSAWIKPEKVNNVRIINDRGTGAGGSYKGFQLKIRESGGQWFFRDAGIDDATGKYRECRQCGNSYSKNEWHHVVMVYNNQNNMEFYVNGQLDGTVSIPSDYGPLANRKPLVIGGSYYANDVAGNPSQFFKGTIDEVRVYNRSLTAQEIAQLFAEQ